MIAKLISRIDDNNYYFYFDGHIYEVYDEEFDENESDGDGESHFIRRLEEDEEKEVMKSLGNRNVGSLEEILVDLTKMYIDYFPDELYELLDKEIEEKETENKNNKTRKFEEELEKDPSIDYRRTLQDTDLTEDERMIASNIATIIKEEILNSELSWEQINFENYKKILRKLIEIAKGETLIARHTGLKASAFVNDAIVSRDELKNIELLRKRSFFREPQNDSAYAISSETIPLNGDNTVRIVDETSKYHGYSYLGSYRVNYDGDIVDVIRAENGEIIFVSSLEGLTSYSTNSFRYNTEET